MNFDILILGGGLVGASLLCALKDQNFTIALVDKTAMPFDDPEINLDSRALALSLTSVECLKTIKVWPKVLDNAFAISKIHVSMKGRFGNNILDAKAYSLPSFGFVVNANSLNTAINQTVEDTGKINVFRGQEIFSLKKEDKLWQIQLSSKKTITAKLIVAADGSDSYLRQHQGVGAKISDYKQAAIVVNVRLEQPHKGIAFERFTIDGSLAMLPFGINQVKCVWIVPAEKLEALKSLSENAFLNAIQDCFGYRLGNLVQLGRRIIYPLRTVYSEAIYGDRWVLVGNAANTLYPVAAQGFNLGLRDVAFLAEELILARKNQQDIGSVEFLRHYASFRVSDHQQICQGTDHLLGSNTLFQWLGILACQWIPPLKHGVVKWGLGMQDRLPKLCRGIEL